MAGLEVGGAVEGLKGLKEVAEFIGAELKAASEARATDVEQLKTYAHLALVAIGALEREYDEILNDAFVLDLQDKRALRALQNRLQDYLTIDIIRPRLVQVTAGLEELSLDFVAYSESFLAMKKLDRHLAATNLREIVVDLKGYVKELTAWAPGAGHSGVGMRHLDRLSCFLSQLNKKVIAGNLSNKDGKDLINLIRTFRADRDKDEMLRFYVNLERCYVRVRRVFR